MSKEVPNDKPLTMTPADLQQLISTAIEAARKPVVTDQELQRIEQEQQMRKDQAAQVLAEAAAKRQTQRICSHKHSQRDGGHSHCVYIVDGNYILCQFCQAKVRPGAAPEDFKGNDIYDTDLFNRLFQECGSVGEIIQ